MHDGCFGPTSEDHRKAAFPRHTFQLKHAGSGNTELGGRIICSRRNVGLDTYLGRRKNRRSTGRQEVIEFQPAHVDLSGTIVRQGPWRHQQRNVWIEIAVGAWACRLHASMLTGGDEQWRRRADDYSEGQSRPQE